MNKEIFSQVFGVLVSALLFLWVISGSPVAYTIVLITFIIAVPATFWICTSKNPKAVAIKVEYGSKSKLQFIYKYGWIISLTYAAVYIYTGYILFATLICVNTLMQFIYLRTRH